MPESPRNAPAIPATVTFAHPKKPNAINQGWMIDFAVPPRVGDDFYVEHNSVKKLNDEDLHTGYWKIVSVSHEINLDEFEINGTNPYASLKVTVHPKDPR